MQESLVYTDGRKVIPSAVTRKGMSDEVTDAQEIIDNAVIVCNGGNVMRRKWLGVSIYVTGNGQTLQLEFTTRLTNNSKEALTWIFENLSPECRVHWHGLELQVKDIR